jgi:hypothetical protein
LAEFGWRFDRSIDVHLMQFNLDPTGASPNAPGIDVTGVLA